MQRIRKKSCNWVQERECRFQIEVETKPPCHVPCFDSRDILVGKVEATSRSSTEDVCETLNCMFCDVRQLRERDGPSIVFKTSSSGGTWSGEISWRPQQGRSSPTRMCNSQIGAVICDYLSEWFGDTFSPEKITFPNNFGPQKFPVVGIVGAHWLYSQLPSAM